MLIHEVDPRRIRVPRSADPTVSIIIPSYGKVEYTLSCLASIAAQSARGGHRGNRRRRRDARWLDRLPGFGAGHPADRQSEQPWVSPLLQHRRSRRQGRVSAAAEQRHAGACRAGSMPLLIAVPTRAAMSARSAPSCCILTAGCRRRAASSGTTAPAGISAGSIARTGLPTTICAKWTTARRHRCWCRAPCSTRMGGFDERYAPAYCEDSDLAFRLRERGYKVLYQPRSRVVHYEGVTHGRSLSGCLKSCQARNQRTFQERWLSGSVAPASAERRTCHARARSRAATRGHPGDRSLCARARPRRRLAHDAVHHPWPAAGGHGGEVLAAQSALSVRDIPRRCRTSAWKSPMAATPIRSAGGWRRTARISTMRCCAARR